MKTKYVKSHAAKKPPAGGPPAEKRPDEKSPPFKSEPPQEQPAEEKPPKKHFFKNRTQKAEHADTQASGEKPPKKRFFKKRAPKAEQPDPRTAGDKPPKKRFFQRRAQAAKPMKDRSSGKRFLKPLLILLPCAVLAIALSTFFALSMSSRYTYSPPSYSYTPVPAEQPEKEAEREEPPQEQKSPEEIELPEDTEPPEEPGDSSQDPRERTDEYQDPEDIFMRSYHANLRSFDSNFRNAENTEPPVDKASIQEKLDLLLQNRPTMLTDCTFCDGNGNSSTLCERCGGSGSISPPGVTMFQTFIDCPRCGGDKYEPCGHCTFGRMNDPDFETKIAEWHEKRRALWKKLGYSDEEISSMEMEEAKNTLEEREEPITITPSISDDSPSISGGEKGICRVCNTTGRCPTCDGNRRYINPFTGEFITCSSCTDGNCWKCGGTGRA